MSSPSTQPAFEQLAELKQQFESCSASARVLVESVSDAEFQESSKTGGWSIAECLEHLTATTHLYLPILQSELANAPAGKGPYKMDWRGRLLKWVLEPPYRTKVKTLPSLEPRIQDFRRVLPDFLAGQQKLFAAMDLWSGRALNKVIITSPFNKRLRYNIFSLFNILAAHQRHHLWQAQRVKNQIKGH